MECPNKIVNSNGSLSVTLDVYVFMDGDSYIAYSPALDLSGYCESEEAAKDSFSVVMDEYIAYGVSRRTLVKDLHAHGWKVNTTRKQPI